MNTTRILRLVFNLLSTLRIYAVANVSDHHIIFRDSDGNSYRIDVTPHIDMEEVVE